MDRWVKEKAIATTGSVALTKFVLSDEQRRLQRLKNVKSNVSSQMKHNSYIASKVDGRLKSLKHAPPPPSPPAFDTRPSNVVQHGSTKTGLRAAPLRDTDLLTTSKQQEQQRRRQQQRAGRTPDEADAEAVGLPPLVRRSPGAAVSSNGSKSLAPPPGGGGGRRQRSPEETVDLSYLDGVALTAADLDLLIPRFEVGLTDRTLPPQERRRIIQSVSGRKDALLFDRAGGGGGKGGGTAADDVLEGRAALGRDDDDDDRMAGGAVGVMSGGAAAGSGMMLSRSQRQVVPDSVVRLRPMEGASRSAGHLGMGGEVKGKGGEGGRVGRRNRPSAEAEEDMKAKAAWDPNYERPWRDYGKKQRKIKRGLEKEKREQKMRRGEDDDVDYDGDVRLPQVFHPRKDRGVFEDDRGSDDEGANNNTPSRKKGGRKNNKQHYYNDAGENDDDNVNYDDLEPAEQLKLLVASGGKLASKMLQSSPPPPANVEQRTPTVKRLQKARAAGVTKGKELAELKSEYSEALAILKDLTGRMQLGETKQDLSPMLARRFGDDVTAARPQDVRMGAQILFPDDGVEERQKEIVAATAALTAAASAPVAAVPSATNVAAATAPADTPLDSETLQRKRAMDDYNKWWKEQQLKDKIGSKPTTPSTVDASPFAEAATTQTPSSIMRKNSRYSGEKKSIDGPASAALDSAQASAERRSSDNNNTLSFAPQKSPADAPQSPTSQRRRSSIKDRPSTPTARSPASPRQQQTPFFAGAEPSVTNADEPLPSPSGPGENSRSSKTAKLAVDVSEDYSDDDENDEHDIYAVLGPQATAPAPSSKSPPSGPALRRNSRYSGEGASLNEGGKQISPAGTSSVDDSGRRKSSVMFAQPTIVAGTSPEKDETGHARRASVKDRPKTPPLHGRPQLINEDEDEDEDEDNTSINANASLKTPSSVSVKSSPSGIRRNSRFSNSGAVPSPVEDSPSRRKSSVMFSAVSANVGQERVDVVAPASQTRRPSVKERPKTPPPKSPAADENEDDDEDEDIPSAPFSGSPSAVLSISPSPPSGIRRNSRFSPASSVPAVHESPPNRRKTSVMFSSSLEPPPLAVELPAPERVEVTTPEVPVRRMSVKERPKTPPLKRPESDLGTDGDEEEEEEEDSDDVPASDAAIVKPLAISTLPSVSPGLVKSPPSGIRRNSRFSDPGVIPVIEAASPIRRKTSVMFSSSVDPPPLDVKLPSPERVEVAAPAVQIRRPSVKERPKTPPPKSPPKKEGGGKEEEDEEEEEEEDIGKKTPSVAAGTDAGINPAASPAPSSTGSSPSKSPPAPSSLRRGSRFGDAVSTPSPDAVDNPNRRRSSVQFSPPKVNDSQANDSAVSEAGQKRRASIKERPKTPPPRPSIAEDASAGDFKSANTASLFGGGGGGIGQLESVLNKAADEEQSFSVYEQLQREWAAQEAEIKKKKEEDTAPPSSATDAAKDASYFDDSLDDDDESAAASFADMPAEEYEASVHHLPAVPIPKMNLHAKKWDGENGAGSVGGLDESGDWSVGPGADEGKLDDSGAFDVIGTNMMTLSPKTRASPVGTVACSPGDGVVEVPEEEDLVVEEKEEGLGGRIYHADGTFTTTTDNVGREIERLKVGSGKGVVEEDVLEESTGS